VSGRAGTTAEAIAEVQRIGMPPAALDSRFRGDDTADRDVVSARLKTESLHHPARFAEALAQHPVVPAKAGTQCLEQLVQFTGVLTPRHVIRAIAATHSLDHRADALTMSLSTRVRHEAARTPVAGGHHG